MFISEANYISKFVLQAFSQEMSGHSLDLSYCMTFYLLPQSFPARQKLAVRCQVDTKVSPVLALLQRGRVILEARAWVLHYNIVELSLCMGPMSVKPHFSQLWNGDNTAF